MSEITEYSEKADEMARLVNSERISAGLKPLYVVPYLNKVAMLRAKEASEYMSHTRPNGEYFITAVDTNIIDYGAITENIAAGNESAEVTLEQWRNSPEHWAAIVNENYTHMGVGLVYNPDGASGYGWYWVQIFSNDLGGPDVVYDGQYMAEPYTAEKITIHFGDDDGWGGDYNNLSGIKIRIQSTKSIAGLNNFQITINQNGEKTETEIDSHNIYFTSGNYPTEITGLPPGNYKISLAEKGKDGYAQYKPGNDIFKIDAKGVSDRYDINVEIYEIHLEAIISDRQTNKYIENAIFEISGNNNQDLSNVKINKRCAISRNEKVITFKSAWTPYDGATFLNSPRFDKISAGNYTLKETEIPVGYKSAGNYSANVYNQLSNSVSIYYEPISVTIDVYGVNEESKQIPVSGAKFGLTSLDNGNLENVVCTGTDVSALVSAMKFTADSTTSLKYLPAGSYRLVELTPPDGYISAKEITFNIDENGKIINLTNAILVNDTTIKIVHEKYGAFENARKLRKIIIPESVKKIGIKSFADTALKSAKIASDCEYSESSFPENCGIEFY